MTSQKADILQRILTAKREEVVNKKAATPLDVMVERAKECKFPLRGFRSAMQSRVQQQKPAIIAELKKSSPSKGVIRETFDLFCIARAYERGQATCLSVLTDHEFFQGHDSHLLEVRETVDLPLLRKDFILDPYQVYESRVLGADAVLLIVAGLELPEIEFLHSLARSLGLDVLIEVHSVAEYETIAHLADDALIGVNNRNLKTFEVDTTISLDIAQALKPGQWCITESGISQREQVVAMMKAGIYGFLVGEGLMRYEMPDEGIRELFPENFDEDLS